MNDSGNAMLCSMLVGTLGVGVFIYGKRQSRFPHLVAGVLMMGYPYFVSSVALMLGIFVALSFALWGATRLGA